MAHYSLRLCDVFKWFSREEVESWFKSYNLADYLLPEQLEIINNSPIFSKDKLAKKIIDHYFMDEIGFETIALFRHFTKITMEEIMEEKLPLIYTICLEYDPLVNVDFTETYSSSSEGTVNSSGNSSNKVEGNSNSNSSNNSSGLSINSNTPQGQINKQQILNGTYATDTHANENSSSINDSTNQSSNQTINNSNEGNSKNKEEYTKHFKGNQGISATYQAMIKQFRDNIRAVEKEIIDECYQLFMLIY